MGIMGSEVAKNAASESVGGPSTYWLQGQGMVVDGGRQQKCKLCVWPGVVWLGVCRADVILMDDDFSSIVNGIGR